MALIAASGCGSDDGDDGAGGTTPADVPSTAAAGSGEGGASPSPEVPAAALEEISAPGAPFVAALPSGDDPMGEAGFVERELTASGTATSYRSEGELPTDGTFELVEDAEADYRTRILVRAPEDPADFNGTVLLEWMNVSAGLDAIPDYSYSIEEIHRGGYAWVGVSAQHIGVEGGPVAVTTGADGGLAGQGLKKIDPERYGDLYHPGDAFSYDIYSQVAAALRSEAGAEVLGAEPQRVIAMGESQSGFALTTYANGVQPLTSMFDGFLIHSRGGGTAPLGTAGEGIDITAAIVSPPTTVRTDLDVPVLILEAEGDLTSVIGYASARQEDTEMIRVWEIAGASHADAFMLGGAADTFDCGLPINDGPHNFVAKAALRALDTWVRTGEAPPSAEPIEIVDGEIVRDDDGIALGGIRTPLVDVPLAVYTSETAEGVDVACLLFGSTQPLPEPDAAIRYGSQEEYMAAFEASLDEAIAAGFVLEDDREALLARAGSIDG